MVWGDVDEAPGDVPEAASEASVATHMTQTRTAVESVEQPSVASATPQDDGASDADQRPARSGLTRRTSTISLEMETRRRSSTISLETETETTTRPQDKTDQAISSSHPSSGHGDPDRERPISIV